MKMPKLSAAVRLWAEAEFSEKCEQLMKAEQRADEVRAQHRAAIASRNPVEAEKTLEVLERALSLQHLARCGVYVARSTLIGLGMLPQPPAAE